jgi:hypothetical protein
VLTLRDAIMRARVVTAVLALFLALQPLSTWTLLGVFGTDHTVRLAMVDGELDLILVHPEDSPAGFHHHHTATDRILATSADHAVGAGNHVIRSIQSDVTPPKRAAIALPLMTAWAGPPPLLRADSLAPHLVDTSLSLAPLSRTTPLLL